MTSSQSLTSRDIPPHQRIVVLPLGAWEQHGPHLPLSTDTIIVNAVIHSALSTDSSLLERFVVAPTVPITASDEHNDFSGTLSMGTDALVNAVVSICRSAVRWANGVLIVNGHGGNFDALRSIESALIYEKTPHKIWTLPHYDGGDMHAGHTETSLLLHIDSDLVQASFIPHEPVTDVDISQLRSSGVYSVSTTGILGDPSRATPEHGAEILRLYTSSLLRAMDECSSQWLNVDQ